MRFLSSMCNLQQKQIAWNWTNNECFPFKFMVTPIMTQLHKACSITHDNRQQIIFLSFTLGSKNNNILQF